jgi:putative membrane protein
MRTVFGIALALMVGAVAAVQGQRGDSPQDKLSDADRMFVEKAAAAGLAEVNLSELALKQASREDVKKFAKMMVDDHGKANKELLDIVNKKKLTPPREMSKVHKDAMDKLSTLKGDDFDTTYMRQMVKDHEEAVSLFEKQSKDGQDADLKKFAGDKLPTLKEHLDMAKKIADKKGSDK